MKVKCIPGTYNGKLSGTQENIFKNHRKIKTSSLVPGLVLVFHFNGLYT